MSALTRFIEWWEGLTPEQRREQITRARKRKAYWLARRSQVLFGTPEKDAIFGVLEMGDLIVQPKEEN